MGEKILLVEDEAVVAIAERRRLEAAGYMVEVAGDAKSAIEKATSDPDIKLVLMDIDLGSEIDGTVAAERILESRELAIVFLTGHSEKEIVERVKGITRYGYVLKNSGTFVLLEAISMALELFQSTQRLRASEARYHSLFLASENPILLFDPEGALLDANPAAERLLRITTLDGPGEPMLERIKQAVESGEAREFVDPVVDVDGNRHWFRSVVRPLPPERSGGEPLVQVTAYDITSFTELEEELKVGLGERFARAVTEIAPIMMYVYDRRERRNIWANRSYLEAVASFAGVVVSELEEVDIMGLIHPDDRALIVDRNKTWGAGGPPPLDDIEIRLGDGTHWTWFLHRSAAFERGEAGDITKTIGFLTDISLQKTAEAQLQRHCRGR